MEQHPTLHQETAGRAHDPPAPGVQGAGVAHDPAARGTRPGLRKSPRPAGRDRSHLSLAGSPAATSPPGRARGRSGRGGLSGSWWLAVVPAAILLIVALVIASQAGSGAPRNARVVVASLPYWSIGPGTDSVLANRNDINEISPWMYGLGSNGQIILDSGINRASLTADLNRLRNRGLPIVPTVANVDTQGNWDYGTVARVLHNPALAAHQVAEIVALADSNHYAGIDLDYENLQAGDRQAFTAFVTSLAAALHAKGKILSVAVFAKASDAGYAPRNVAQDYAAIGQAADQVRLMGYDYHWDTSPAGPVAPIYWIRDVIRYARSQIPAPKIVLGIPEYGYDWSGGFGTSITWLQALRLSRQYHTGPQYDASSQSPWFTYTDASQRKHTVWFENAESAKAKLDAAQGIGGVYLWMYGYPDPGTWGVLHQTLPIPAHSASPAPGGPA
jgi:spore germination protein YaaH